MSETDLQTLTEHALFMQEEQLKIKGELK